MSTEEAAEANEVLVVALGGGDVLEDGEIARRVAVSADWRRKLHVSIAKGGRYCSLPPTIFASASRIRHMLRVYTIYH